MKEIKLELPAPLHSTDIVNVVNLHVRSGVPADQLVGALEIIKLCLIKNHIRDM